MLGTIPWTSVHPAVQLVEEGHGPARRATAIVYAHRSGSDIVIDTIPLGLFNDAEETREVRPQGQGEGGRT
jgi:hypothetical protein